MNCSFPDPPSCPPQPSLLPFLTILHPYSGVAVSFEDALPGYTALGINV